MKSLWIFPAARTDILEHYAYLLQQDKPKVAKRFFAAVPKGFEQIQQMPAMGGLRYFESPKLQGVRSWPVPGFAKIRIYYLEKEYEIHIIRVLHGNRDTKKLLS